MSYILDEVARFGGRSVKSCDFQSLDPIRVFPARIMMEFTDGSALVLDVGSLMVRRPDGSASEFHDAQRSEDS